MPIVIGQMNTVLNPSPDDSDTEILIVENSETVEMTRLQVFIVIILLLYYFHHNKFLQKSLYKLQKDRNTFINHPEEKLSKQFQCWLEMIDDQLSDELIARHVNSSEILKQQYAILVPDFVEHHMFWKR